MEQSINALQHPNTWSKQQHWPVDVQGNPIYHQNSEMSATIAQLRQHFKGCDYQKKLVLKKDRQVHSPDIRECIRAQVTDNHVTLHRNIRVQPFAEVVSISGLAGMNGCESHAANEGCLQIRLGKDRNADNYYRCGCCIQEESISIRLPKPQALKRAILQEARWDDRLQLWMNDQKVWQSNEDFPPETAGRCERNKNVFLNHPVTLGHDLFKSPDRQLRIKIRTSVGDEGEGYALLKLFFDTRRLVDEDRWTPASALEQLAAMQQWQQDGLCHLQFQCLERLTEAEHTIHGKIIALNPLSPKLPSDCKTVQANADCFLLQDDSHTLSTRSLRSI